MTTSQGYAIRKAWEVLKAIDEQFQEGADRVYANAHLFDDDCNLNEYVAAAVWCCWKGR
jgi:hypothetical protein